MFVIGKEDGVVGFSVTVEGCAGGCIGVCCWDGWDGWEGECECGAAGSRNAGGG